ncbi:serine/threonine-protein kinase [uncultured Roseibium sp.]|uniref:serine/threonine-protein kinase n=1 Tax=uncultured Roseibium sp. TaxID=1936171 RepID=UPI002603D78B|nr:serine/threonine-protein kinase [uncultured Roseibium sp.]
MSDFVSGRLSYEKLSKQLRALATRSTEDLQNAHQAIASLVEEGRLPRDLGAILLSQLPAAPAGSPAAPATIPEEQDLLEDRNSTLPPPDAEDMFDEPTLPHGVTPEWREGSATGTGGGGMQPFAAPQATPPQEKLPPLPFLTQAPAASGEDMRDKVDDAILSSLVSDYTDFRNTRGSSEQAQSGQADAGKLDKFLTDFKSARFRSDARRASSGVRTESLDLNKLSSPQIKRAGVGSILRDRFILDTEIGRGGMGYVYSAVDRRRLEAGHNQPYVAVKLLNESFQNDSEALRLLEAEARKSQALAHPNITTVYDFDRDKADVFIVMELLDGVALDRRLGQAMGLPLSPAECARILRGTCAGLSYAHSRGVVHSDLKPGNIFLLQDGTIKLLDFGLAAAASASADHPIQDSLTVTYASPEQFERAPRDPRDDVFALGCVAFQILAGRHPFDSRPIDEVARAGINPEPIEGLDTQAWETLKSALEFDRQRRLADVDSFLAGLFEDGATE